MNFYMLPASQSDISTTSSFSRRIACDKLSLSVKGAGIAVGDDWGLFHFAVNMSFALSFLLASPRGEVASRSDDGEGLCVAIKYRSSQKQFSSAVGHNANFVWNQDEASVKFDSR